MQQSWHPQAILRFRMEKAPKKWLFEYFYSTSWPHLLFSSHLNEHLVIFPKNHEFWPKNDLENPSKQKFENPAQYVTR